MPRTLDRTVIIQALIGAVVALGTSWIGTKKTIELSGGQLQENAVKIDRLASQASAVEGALNEVIPVGAVIAFSGSLATDANMDRLAGIGWLACRGQFVRRQEYPRLYDAIGTQYGASDVEGQFRLPDVRGRTLVGAGRGEGLTERMLADRFGQEAVVLSVGQLPKHRHSYKDSRYYDQIAKTDPRYDPKRATREGDDNGGLEIEVGETEYEGESQPVGVMQPSLVQHYMIKAR